MKLARDVTTALLVLLILLCTAALVLPSVLPYVAVLVVLAILTRMVWFYTGRW